MKKGDTILSHWLGLLGVRFTAAYTDSRFERMPFKTLFGLQQLLKEYGVASQGFKFDPQALTVADLESVRCPYIARTTKGLVIVTGIDSLNVNYISQGVDESIPTTEFLRAWTGEVFTATPTSSSEEPDFKEHRMDEVMVMLRNRGLLLGILALFAYLFISNGLWRHVSTILLTLLDLAGLTLTVMLVQKSLKIHNRAADKVCKVLQEGGCDTVLDMKASKVFGIFGWAEVGLTYFTVSLLCLLIFPQWICYLAACNILCLPFTFWSIWYQKFRAKVWCTLCVSVQCTLWLLFFCYLGGGWLTGIFPLRIEFFVLGVTYLTTLLALNKLSPYFSNAEPEAN